MPREVVMQLWCDPCDQNGVQVLAVASWTVGAVKADVQPSLHTVDTCEEHNGEMEVWFAMVNASPPFVRSKPAAPAAPARSAAAAEYPCPVCEQPFATVSGRLSHVWQVHRAGESRGGGGVCPDCKVDFPSPQGFAAHRRQAHGFDALTDALAGVKGYKAKVVRGA